MPGSLSQFGDDGRAVTDFATEEFFRLPGSDAVTKGAVAANTS
jgi:hypothetical protein